MEPSYLKPTLYQDWIHRRDELVDQDRQGSRHAKTLLPVFEFLIREFRDEETVNRPARFPRSSALEINERAIIVHRHLGRGIASAVKSTEAAETRIRAVLGRLAVDQQAGKDEPSTENAEVSLESELDDGVFQYSHQQYDVSKSAKAAAKSVRSGRRADNKIRQGLHQSPYLPSLLLNHLADRIDQAQSSDKDGLDALFLLFKCENRNICNFVIRVWRNRIVDKREDDILSLLTRYLLAPDHRDEKLERLRIALSDEDGRVRNSAITLLSQIGTLDDIGLLADLLLLPPLADELPNERDALREAINRIANMTQD